MDCPCEDQLYTTVVSAEHKIFLYKIEHLPSNLMENLSINLNFPTMLALLGLMPIKSASFKEQNKTHKKTYFSCIYFVGNFQKASTSL